MAPDEPGFHRFVYTRLRGLHLFAIPLIGKPGLLGFDQCIFLENRHSILSVLPGASDVGTVDRLIGASDAYKYSHKDQYNPQHADFAHLLCNVIRFPGLRPASRSVRSGLPPLIIIAAPMIISSPIVIIIVAPVIITPPVVITPPIVVPSPVVVVVIIVFLAVSLLGIPPLPLLDRSFLLFFTHLLCDLVPLPSKSHIVRTNGENTNAEEIHREGFVPQFLLLVRAHLPFFDSVFTSVVRLCGLVETVTGGNGSNGGQTSGQKYVLAALPLLLSLFGRRVVTQFFHFVFGVVVAFVAARNMPETFAVLLQPLRPAARCVRVGVFIRVRLVIISTLNLT